MHLEVDIYWAWRGAADPVDIIRANPGRVRQFHVKDMNIESGFTDPGTGLIDFGDLSQSWAVAEIAVTAASNAVGTIPAGPSGGGRRDGRRRTLSSSRSSAATTPRSCLSSSTISAADCELRFAERGLSCSVIGSETPVSILILLPVDQTARAM